MGMQIIIPDTDQLSASDIEALRVYTGGGTPTAAAPAAKAPAAKKAAASKTPAPAPDPEPEDEDLVGGDDEAPTQKQVVARATELITGGEQARVKTALNGLGFKKVSELTPDNYAAFLEAVAD